MTERKTLTLNKSIRPANHKATAPNPFKALMSEIVTTQTKDPTVINGRVEGYESGFITLAEVSEFRLKYNDRIEPEDEHESMMLDRSAIQFLAR